MLTLLLLSWMLLADGFEELMHADRDVVIKVINKMILIITIKFNAESSLITRIISLKGKIILQ